MDWVHTKVLTNTRQMVEASNTVGLEDTLVADAGQLQYLGRLDSTYLREFGDFNKGRITLTYLRKR